MPDRGARRVFATVVLFVATAVVLPATPVGVIAGAAQSVSSEQLRTLAERASSDPVALRQLRDVDRVDDRPVDLRRVLDGAEGEDLRSRLRMLASGPDEGRPPSGGDTSPREEARRILDGRKFQPAPTIRPFRGALRRLGGWLRPIGEPLGRIWNRAAGNTPGRAALVVAVMGAAALVSVGLIRRRTKAGLASPRRGPGERRDGTDPGALEREADAAERAGDLDWAFRLRFRAGLLRLDEAGAIAYRPALTTGALTRTVPSPRLVGLASAFEEITYGGRPAGIDDLRAARAEWPRVLEEVGRR